MPRMRAHFIVILSTIFKQYLGSSQDLKAFTMCGYRWANMLRDPADDMGDIWWAESKKVVEGHSSPWRMNRRRCSVELWCGEVR